jgi:hypothetical protein
MSRFFTVAIALVCLSMGAFMLPVLSQVPEKPKVAAGVNAPPGLLEMTQRLQTTIDTKPLQKPLKFRDALKHISDIIPGVLPIRVDTEALMDGAAAPPDPYEEEVGLHPVPARMTIDRALRTILAQVARGRAILVIHKDWLEITTAQASSATQMFYSQWVVASYKQRPLIEVLEDLSDMAEIAINLDPSVGDKANTAISATFLNCSFEEAMVTVTEMTKLSYVLLDRSIYITTPEHAKTMERDEAARRKKRSEIELPGKRKEGV